MKKLPTKKEAVEDLLNVNALMNRERHRLKELLKEFNDLELRLTLFFADNGLEYEAEDLNSVLADIEQANKYFNRIYESSFKRKRKHEPEPNGPSIRRNKKRV